MYTTSISSIEKLRDRIKFELRRIRPEILTKVSENLKLLLNYLRNVDGGHIEILIN